MSSKPKIEKTADTKALWLSPIIKKRKKAKSPTVASSRKRDAPIVSPILKWYQPTKELTIHHIRRASLSVPTRSYKSTVANYHNDPKIPAPGDLIRATVEQMAHPAYMMTESIGVAYVLFEKVKYFTLERFRGH